MSKERNPPYLLSSLAVRPITNGFLLSIKTHFQGGEIYVNPDTAREVALPDVQAIMKYLTDLLVEGEALS